MQHGTSKENVIDTLENVEAVLIGEALRRDLPMGDVIGNLHRAIKVVEDDLIDRSTTCERCGREITKDSRGRWMVESQALPLVCGTTETGVRESVREGHRPADPGDGREAEIEAAEAMEVQSYEPEPDRAELASALEAMLELIISGRHYQTQNPYTRPEVNQAYRALGRDWRDDGLGATYRNG